MASCDPDLELGWTPHELRQRVADALQAAADLGLEGCRVLAYLAIVDPTLPGSHERLAWRREIRRRFGRARRSRERAAVHQRSFAFPPPTMR